MPRMTEEEYQALKAKIEREFPVRLRLAVLAGRPPINPKNVKQLEEFDDTIPELFMEIALKKPENVEEATTLIRNLGGQS
jgi:hypothetical protein